MNHQVKEFDVFAWEKNSVQ